MNKISKSPEYTAALDEIPNHRSELELGLRMPYQLSTHVRFQHLRLFSQFKNRFGCRLDLILIRALSMLLVFPLVSTFLAHVGGGFNGEWDTGSFRLLEITYKAGLQCGKLTVG